LWGESILLCGRHGNRMFDHEIVIGLRFLGTVRTVRCKCERMDAYRHTQKRRNGWSSKLDLNCAVSHYLHNTEESFVWHTAQGPQACRCRYAGLEHLFPPQEPVYSDFIFASWLHLYRAQLRSRTRPHRSWQDTRARRQGCNLWLCCYPGQARNLSVVFE
jgi:hypothetical protein